MQKIYIRMQKCTCAKLHTCVKANLLRVYMDVLKGVYFNSVLYLVFFFHHIEFQNSESLHNLNGNGKGLSQQRGLDLNLVFSRQNRNFHVPRKILKKGIGRLIPHSDMSG